MRKRFFQRNVFLKFLMVLLAIGWSTSAVQAANTWWRLRVIAIHRDGTPANSYVAAYGNGGTDGTFTTNDSIMPAPSNSVNYYQTKAAVVISKQAQKGEIFQGLYKEAACTTLLANAFTRPWYAETSDVPLYATSEEAARDTNLVTVYALFSEPTSLKGDTPPDTGEYYIFNKGRAGFISPGTITGSQKTTFSLQWTADANNALLFTLSNRSSGNKQITAIINAVTWYLKKAGSALDIDTSTEEEQIIESSGGYTQVKFPNNSNKYWASSSSGTFTSNTTNDDYRNWSFISRQTFLNSCKVKSKKSDGSVLIDSPTGEGTAYVSFNVSELGNVSDFEYSLSNTEYWEIVDTTRNGNVITLGVKYSAQGVGDFSTTIVTMSNKANPTSEAFTSKTATASAAVSFTPVCSMAVGSKLDWSYEGEELKETFNAGMEVAASQRMRTKDKLVYNGNNAIVRDVATWTATITGTNADQFKFSNGEQEISGTYSPELLDVIYAPTASGTHTATLQVVVSYATVSSTPVTVTLSGTSQDASSMVAMAVNGATASNNASLNLGDIIGTNSQDVTVDLYIQGMSNLTKEWSAPAGTFEFDENSLDLSKANQTLTFRAHRSTAVTEATNHTGTLTIKSSGSTVGTLTLTYTAKPLLTPTVTWNWATLNEDATYTNPLTIVSDGAWTLEQKDGNGGMTYDAETKSITTEYMHHESGYMATFELTIPQTNTYSARTDTLYATISANIPPVIEIKNATDYATYVEGNSWVSYKADINAVNIGSDKAYFKWSGQSYFTFDFALVSGTGSHSPSIYEMYSDGTEKLISNQALNHGSSYGFPVSPHAIKVKIHGSNNYKNIRYFEYDTIDVNYDGVTFVENGATTRDITATFANKRAVTVSLNAAAQPYFELRAEGKPTGSTLVYDSADGLAVHKFVKGKVFTVAIKDGVNYDEAKAAAANGFQVILQDNFTYNSEVVVLPIALENSYNVTYKHDTNGSYKVTYHDNMNNPHTVSTSADYVHTVLSIVETSCTATLSDPDAADGYMFRGWKVNGNLVSCKATQTVIPGNGATVEPVFVPAEEAVYGIDAARFADLDEALSTAGSIADTKPVVTLLKDVTLSEAATHTIPAGVTLLIPYKADFNALQVTPEITTTDEVLSAYRTLTLKEGVNIVVNGNICVSGKIKATGGGFKSAYTTGECGVINMATGGHIELNNGAQLYCWGYIKGQDMDQGNNTQGTGTVTVNSGAIVHENFELGDWRGGTASSNIYYERESKHLFPFQSYALQNVEVPTTYTYGSKLETFMAVNTGFGSIPFAVSMIGSQNTLFLLQDEGSVIRKWYDPTTDLTCYELSGTAQLDELVMNLPFVGNFKSGDCNLPVSNSMHVILANCDMTLSKPLTVQAGAVLEIKNTATVDLTAKIHLFDVDEWGLYIHNYYFRSFNNLTSHKDRGAENSKAGLEDAKFIIDGTLNVKSGQGYIYATAGGANLMGNGGGKIVFEGALPTAGELWHVTVLGQKPYITWVPTTEKAANLCNEDGTYTKSAGYETYYNVHGRWFRDGLNVENENHTYSFEYMSTNNSEELDTYAVYSHDKTGLEARMKWFNVTMDENCLNYNPDPENIDDTSDWWKGTNPTAYYNYTMLNDWHQFMATEEAGVYSGSNNMLYQKDGCTWVETGAVDENCLYTFEEGGNLIKKALVDGHFIPLTSNGYDPAYYHEENEVKTYYICFQGCNWHPATPYDGESKAYTIHPEDVDLHYIWFNGDWMNVKRDEPFFYTEDEQTNVRTYYEYVNGDWIVATPYVSVSDAIDPEPNPRTFYMIKEAFNVASIKKDATITLLRDLANIDEVLTYTTQNTTCTLDLNGHTLAGNIANLITVNAPGATFTITDNTGLKLGKISNAASKAVYVQKGTLVVANGTIESSAAYAIEGAATTAININGGYFAATTKCVQTAGSCAITGGYYNINTGLANYTVDAYPFANDDPVYKWVVEAAWTIIFKNGETTLQTLHLHPGEMPVYTAAFPTLDNHQFTGWNPAVAAATANVTYQAQFAELEGEEKCVTFNANGGNATLPYKYVTSDDPVGDLPTATKAGHTFTGWFTEASAGTEVTSSTTVSADVTYYAHYTKNSYTLTWNANGATITSADDAYTHGSVEYGTAIIVPSVSKEGWTFDGWNVTPASTMPAANTTYTAQWTIPYTVQHKQQNLNDAGYTVFETDNFTAKSGEYITPAVKTYDGFISPAATTVQIGAVTEVTYEYARREYTIALDATTNEGSCGTASVNVKHGATIETLPAATKAGRVFEGWFTKAVGGDKITSETVIQYNIGTLYAQFSEAKMDVTAPTTISDDRTMTDLRVTTTGKLTITGNVTVTNFILESNGETASGQFVAGHANLHATNAYFDLKLNTPARHWHAFGVPWAIGNLDNVKLIADGTPLTLGRDYDIIWYDGAERATNGPGTNCWKYVEHYGKTLTPGVGYMIAFTRAVNKVRFTKASGASILYDGSVTLQAAGEGTNKGINAVANPMVYHANMNLEGVGQVHDGGEIGSDGYSEVTISGMNYIVGKTVYIQVDAEQTISVSNTKISPAAAPVRRAARATDKKYLTLEDYYTVSLTNANGIGNKLYVLPEEDKENKYVIGHDLVKMGMSTKKAQIWINRYGANLGLNTTAPVEGVAEFPINLYAPAAGEYTISSIQPSVVSDQNDYTVYLTQNGEAIWNLSDAPYALSLSAGVNKTYGLRLSARKSPQTTTGIDEAVVDAQGETRKVLINNQVFIIRGNNVYSVDGQLVK